MVLVRESAKDLFPADPVLGEVDLRWPGVSLSRGELAEGTVRPGGVVVLWGPKTCATWQDAPLTAACSAPRRLPGRGMILGLWG